MAALGKLRPQTLWDVRSGPGWGPLPEIQNSAARKLAVPDLTTTVLTMTLTGIGADSPSGHRGHITLIRRILVVAVMLAGGALGAWLVLNVGVVVPLALATGLLAMLAASAVLASRKPAEWRPVAPAGPAPASAPAQTSPPNQG